MTIFQDKLLTITDCVEAGDYVVPNVLSPRDLVFRPDIGHKLYHHMVLGVSPNCVVLTCSLVLKYGYIPSGQTINLISNCVVLKHTPVIFFL